MRSDGRHIFEVVPKENGARGYMVRPFHGDLASLLVWKNEAPMSGTYTVSPAMCEDLVGGPNRVECAKAAMCRCGGQTLWFLVLVMRQASDRPDTDHLSSAVDGVIASLPSPAPGHLGPPREATDAITHFRTAFTLHPPTRGHHIWTPTGVEGDGTTVVYGAPFHQTAYHKTFLDTSFATDEGLKSLLGVVAPDLDRGPDYCYLSRDMDSTELGLYQKPHLRYRGNDIIVVFGKYTEPGHFDCHLALMQYNNQVYQVSYFLASQPPALHAPPDRPQFSLTLADYKKTAEKVVITLRLLMYAMDFESPIQKASFDLLVEHCLEHRHSVFHPQG